MASFADAVNALVAERDRQFVVRIAADYNLNFEELHQKYLETAEAAIKVPRKYKKREATSVTVVTEPKPAKVPKEPKAKAEKQKCTACTSKKEPCKFSALKGEVFCKRHLKQATGEPEEPKKAKEPKKAAKKAEQPVHTHDLNAGIVTDCDLCQSHGNPLVEAEGFELAGPVKTVTVESRQAAGPVCGPIKTVSVESRLAALLAEANDSGAESASDAKSDDDDLGAVEEEYEEED